MAAPGKQYGLILSKKGASKQPGLPRPSIFMDDSDEEATVGESLQKEALKKRGMKQTHLEMQKALEQDSSVYEYDSVYDDIQQQRLESTKRILGGTDRKPKYITQLMRAVEERKKEQERRDERKIQKEREQEGEAFADKEAYVTSAYRQKLLERKEEEEKEKREAAMEAALDVKNQKDLTGFYRHLLNQTVGEETIPECSMQRDKGIKVAEATAVSAPPLLADSQSDEGGAEQKAEFSKPTSNPAHSKRQYRQRSPSSGSGEEDREREKEKERERERKSHREREKDKVKDDRHGGRRDERDRRREREKEREREEDRSGGRRDREREDKHGKRDRKEGRKKERERNGEKERGKEEEGSRDKEREAKDEEERARPEVEDEDQAAPLRKFTKRSNEQTLSSARDRYRARQTARSTNRSYVEKED